MCQHTATLHFLFYLSALEHSTCKIARLRGDGQGKSPFIIDAKASPSLVLPLEPAVPIFLRQRSSPPSLDLTARSSKENQFRRSLELSFMVRTTGSHTHCRSWLETMSIFQKINEIAHGNEHKERWQAAGGQAGSRFRPKPLFSSQIKPLKM